MVTGKPVSLRSLIAIAAIHGYEVHSMDAIAAFLNSKLRELIFMEHPEGYQVGSEKVDLVCLVEQALYGLKKSAREWNEEFKSKCIKAGFVQSVADECVYIRRRGSNVCMFYLHVDDLAITQKDIQSFKDKISISGLWKT